MHPKESTPVTEQQAIAIAKEACRMFGWPWQEPVFVEDCGRTWQVQTNYKPYGCDGLFVVRKATGRVLSGGKEADLRPKRFSRRPKDCVPTNWVRRAIR